MPSIQIDKDIRDALNRKAITWEEAGMIREARKELARAKGKIATLRKKLVPLEQDAADRMAALSRLEAKMDGQQDLPLGD